MTSNGADATFTTAGQAVLFGFPPEPLEVKLRARSRAWRLGGAARRLGVAVVVAPALAVVPPHAPWLIGALALGGLFARRRWSEHFTLVQVAGACPKCGRALDVRSGRLRRPHPLPCEACHHESTLQLPEGVLDERRVP